MSFLGDIGGSIVGGLFNLAGGAINNAFQSQQADEDYQRQKEFAQNSLQWRSQDAVKAGFSPLAALGTNSASYTPSGSAGGGIGDALMNTGQMLDSGLRRALDKDRKTNSAILSEQLKQERLKTVSMEKSLARMGQSPQSNSASGKLPKNSGNVSKKSFTKPEAKWQFYTKGGNVGSRVLQIMPSDKYADSADGTVGAGFQSFIDLHGNPKAIWQETAKMLPKPAKGKKWTLQRGFSGWQYEERPINDEKGGGWFSYN